MNSTLGIFAITIGFIGYIPYFKTMIGGKTKPHAFTWFVWGLLTAIAFAGQIAGNGGAGAWVTGFTALVSFIIFAYAIRWGEKDFPLSDWLCLLGCSVAIVAWLFTKEPLVAIVLITIIDMVAFIPTIRKSYYNPESEPTITYGLSGLKFMIGIVALESMTLTTVLYPASLVIMNGLFVVMLLTLRKRAKIPINT